MTAYKTYHLACDHCYKQYSEKGSSLPITHTETEQCVKDLATDDDWMCDVEDVDGSLYDFCSIECFLDCSLEIKPFEENEEGL